MLTMKVSLLVLLAGVTVFVAGIPQRSARWDAFLSQPHHKRSANSWQGGGRSATCIMTHLTADDGLGRRASGLLSPLNAKEGVVAVGHLHQLMLTPIISP